MTKQPNRVKRNVIRKKTGRKPIGKEAAEVFAMRLPKETAKDVDQFAQSEGIKSRGEAIRKLIEKALKK